MPKLPSSRAVPPAPASAATFRTLRGQSLVEAALVLPLLLVLLLGIVDVGRLLAIHAAVADASRQAARYAAAVGDNAGGTELRYVDCAGIRAAARESSAALIGLIDDQIRISYDDGLGTARGDACAPHGAGPVANDIENFDRVIVEITASYQAINPMVHFLVGPISVESIDRRTIVKGDS